MPASRKQIDYIEILCNDVGFDTRIKRNDFISNLFGREVKFLDDLANVEASQVIVNLKAIKENRSIRDSEVRAYGNLYDPFEDDYQDGMDDGKGSNF